MAIGTAGYTAMLCVMAPERHGVDPDKGEVLVTGANGGGQRGGGDPRRWLHRGGLDRASAADYLRELGAAEIIDRAQAPEPPSAGQGTLGRCGRHGGQPRWLTPARPPCYRGAWSRPVARPRGTCRPRWRCSSQCGDAAGWGTA